jgi:hypothetical protein
MPNPTPLHDACEAGEAAKVAQLIQDGADLEAKASVRQYAAGVPWVFAGLGWEDVPDAGIETGHDVAGSTRAG